ncbi:protein ALP1-like [Camellia sinensis]|uniref:protein ALP1-like n=1 Tax=Camellia sinensis TaxID=4442 RepID=UPI001035D438|nr:protein ALP1-like [Camellia sinensis]
MMRALGNLAPFVIQPPNMAVTHPKIRNDRRYWPWFKDCVGAIDGTHIVVVAPEGDRMPYRGRKVHTTQNVMATCSFDMKFTFVYIGWEGSAHDSRIFLEALTTNSADFPHPPPNKYYLVDAGYTHMPGYVAPYRGQKYHLQEFNRRRRYHGPQELFNHRHSSLRNVIERTFGVLKQRFPLLRHMPRYDMVRQGPIVMACCVLHNWIRTVQEQDEFFDAEESSDEDEDQLCYAVTGTDAESVCSESVLNLCVLCYAVTGTDAESVCSESVLNLCVLCYAVTGTDAESVCSESVLNLCVLCYAVTGTDAESVCSEFVSGTDGEW